MAEAQVEEVEEVEESEETAHTNALVTARTSANTKEKNYDERTQSLASDITNKESSPTFPSL